MEQLNKIETMLKNAYEKLAEDAAKNGGGKSDGVVRCCKCGKTTVTLKKIGDDLYACRDCIGKKIFENAREKLKNKEK